MHIPGRDSYIGVILLAKIARIPIRGSRHINLGMGPESDWRGRVSADSKVAELETATAQSIRTVFRCLAFQLADVSLHPQEKAIIAFLATGARRRARGESIESYSDVFSRGLHELSDLDIYLEDGLRSFLYRHMAGLVGEQLVRWLVVKTSRCERLR